MPLPEGDRTTTNMLWPPLDNRPALDTINTWSAWYSGDPDDLSKVYGRLDARLTSTGLNIRPSQYRGGVVGLLARTFWGRPPAPAEPRTSLHMPLAADISTVSADLLFAEPITVKHEDTKTQDKLVELLNDTLHAQLLESAEVCSGLGGVYLRAVWDRDVNPDAPWISSIHADAAIPEWSYGEMTAVTFYRVLKASDNVVVRWLERHEKGAVFHGVYQGTPELLGRTVPLTEHPETAVFADVVKDGNRIDTGIELLTARYIPNMKPNRLWRNQPANCHLGRSDYSGVELTFDALDEVYSSWMRDIRLAKARLIVPSHYIESKGPGRGGEFNADREVYEAMNMLPATDGTNQITLAQFAIRVEEHERTADHLTKKAIGTSGFSGQSFGLADDTVSVTATEVNARKGRSMSTRDKKILYWRPGAVYMLRVLTELGRVRFGWNVSGEKPPEVIFPDAVQPDPESVARTIQLLDAARSASIETKVILANPDRKDDQEWIAEEVRKIKEENQIGATYIDPGTFTGVPDKDPAAAGKTDSATAPGQKDDK